MQASDIFERTVKIQYHRDAASGGGRAKVGIPVRIRREAAVEAGTFVAWTEQAGKLVAVPVLSPSLHTTTVYPGGRDQIFCLFPGVLWRKYDVQPKAEFHWRLEGQRARGWIAVPKCARRAILARDKTLKLSQTVDLSRQRRHQTRYRVNIPLDYVKALNLKTGQFVCWEECEGGICCTPVRDERMNTTCIEVRKAAGTQVEVPKFLCEKYDLFGKQCTWTLTQGTLTGTVECSRTVS
jgi:bifunctional DNA-binding transcriptional regulator/antitoxin component of YhaV-PrlF toxin-antitoxin module